MNRENKKANHLNSIRGTQRFTKPSQINGDANIVINNETAIPKLRKLAQVDSTSKCKINKNDQRKLSLEKRN